MYGLTGKRTFVEMTQEDEGGDFKRHRLDKVQRIATDGEDNSSDEVDSSVKYVNFSQQEKDKLNAFFGEIVTKTAIDFNNPEIQDIHSAILEMLKRIEKWINQHGILSIDRTELCGSMVEKTAMWKEGPYIEFDFLAVLKAACKVKPGCQECFCVNTLPMNLQLLENYNPSLYNSVFDGKHEQKDLLEECFTRETNNYLASCGCLEVKYRDQMWTKYMFEPSSTYSGTQQDCDKCTVDRPSGTLQVLTSIDMKPCNLIFKWTSKAKKLCTRDSHCLPKTEKMDNLTIHIDFLPALELLQSKQQSDDAAACSSSDLVLNGSSNKKNEKYEHYCFLVPKRCRVCFENRPWRRSGCRAEIYTIVNEMSDKHRKCYQVLKHLTGLYLDNFNNYYLKTASLYHNSSCSDAGEDCAKCVYKVLGELQHATKKTQLKSLHSQGNLLIWDDDIGCIIDSIAISNLKKDMRSALSQSDSVSSFLENVKLAIDKRMSDFEESSESSG